MVTGGARLGEVVVVTVGASGMGLEMGVGIGIGIAVSFLDDLFPLVVPLLSITWVV